MLAPVVRIVRSGIGLQDVIDQLKGIRGPDIIFANGGTIHSLPDAIGQVLESHIKRGQTELGLKFGKEESPSVGTPEMIGSAEVKSSQSQIGNGHSETTSVANMGYAPACPDCVCRSCMSARQSSSPWPRST